MPARSDRPPAIAFVVLSGYASLTVERGDEVAAAAADQLRDLAETCARASGGRLVKLLGDGVLLRFDDAVSALPAVFELVGRVEAAGLPAAHAGQAAAGEIVVEEGVVIALPRGTATFEPIGRVELKGFPTAVALWGASPPPAR